MTIYANTPLEPDPCTICGGPRRKGRRLPYCPSCGQKKTSIDLRLEAVRVYGGKCVCCGEDEKLFLQFHHINGDGKDELRGKQWYRYLIDNIDHERISLLCANCHVGTHLNGGVCPHTAQDNT